jgi:hypothetical protein
VNIAIIRKRDSLVADVEGLLLVWIDDQTSCHVTLNQPIIQDKAQNIVSDMKAKKGEAVKDAEFGASHGWFDRFKKRSNLRNIKVQGEAASADTMAAEIVPWDLVQIIDNGYMKGEIFNADEMGLFWKKIPSGTFIAKEEKTMPGYRPAENRLMLLK